MDNCRRCGTRCSWNHESTELIGGYKTHLCTDCRNTWHAYYLTLPECQDMEHMEALRLTLEGQALAMEAPSEADWAHFVETRNAILKRLFALGEAWVEAGMPAAVAQEG